MSLLTIGPFLLGSVYLASGLPCFRKYFKKSITEKLEETFNNCNLKKDKQLPRLIKKIKTKSGYKLLYTIPSGLSMSDFINNQDALEVATNSSIKMWLSSSGYLTMELNTKPIPNKIGFEFEEIPKGMLLPIPVGYSRRGIEWLDLSEAPHLLVAGQTFGGKSNFLHQALAVLVRLDYVRLFIIDLKRLEFSYLKNHAEYAYKLEKALEMLRFLFIEMHRRLKLLDKVNCVKIQDYFKLCEKDDLLEKLPMITLVCDEVSQLNPDGEMIPDIKEMKLECHKLLSDLAALARCVGIHLVLSTQRPDHKIIPGNLKANIPAKICYPVVSKVNSEIVLDNDLAFYLPHIRGRCLYRFIDQIEVQTMFLSHKRARKLLAKIPHKPKLIKSVRKIV